MSGNLEKAHGKAVIASIYLWSKHICIKTSSANKKAKISPFVWFWAK